MAEMKNNNKILVTDPKEKRNLEYLGVDGRIILKQIFKISFGLDFSGF
jgi:hypothetical protein